MSVPQVYNLGSQGDGEVPGVEEMTPSFKSSQLALYSPFCDGNKGLWKGAGCWGVGEAVLGDVDAR